MIFYDGDDDDDPEDEPCKKEEAKGGQDGLMSRMLKARTVLVTGEVNQELAEKVISQLLLLDAASQEPIRVFITSNGGHVDSGFAIHDVMRFVKSEVISIGAGWVASIAVPILFGAAKKENRLSLPNTRFLIHQPSGGALGPAADIRIEAQEILKIRAKLNEMIAEETGQTSDRIGKDSDRNFWMSAEEAKSYGLIAKVLRHANELDAK
ncbi:MAG: ATP-dependent Clp protease proteolytic subunit [FCB group bacterium]|jgi:ATP-dependent Clp protease protease subunit|nr:ATP-dependent Clp protease proteolytic subunit [FCB group bacterium]